MYGDPFFLLPNTLGWVGMALFPKVLHIVTCKENDIICTANRDNLGGLFWVKPHPAAGGQ